MGGLDGIMYDEPDDKIILTNHSRPIGTLTAIDPKTGDIVATVELEDTAPEGAGGRRQGAHLRQQREQEHDPGDRREDVEGDRVVAARAVRRPDGHRVRQEDEPHLRRLQQDVGGRGRDHRQGRRDDQERRRVDALGWDPSKKLIYIPNGGEGNVTVVHQDSPDKYTSSRRSRRSPAPRRSPSIRRRTTRICSSPSAVPRRRRRQTRRRRHPGADVAAGRSGRSSRRGLS